MKEKTVRDFCLERDQGITSDIAVAIMASIVSTEERWQKVIVKSVANSIGAK